MSKRASRSSKVSSGSTSADENKASWSTIAKENEAQDICRVFSSYKDPQSCGCLLPLQRLVVHLHNQPPAPMCPKCGAPIALVQQRHRLQPGDPTSSSHGDGTSVTFKYGKLVYELLVDDDKRSRKVSVDKPWWMHLVGMFFGGNGDADSSSSSLAQDRIADVLGLSSVKILAKGKVLYPPPHPAMDAAQVSQQILHLSSTTGTSSNKVSLLVMGTVTGQELQDRPTETRSLWSMAVGLGQHIFMSSIALFLHILRQLHSHVIQPLLPTAATNNRSHND